MSTEPTPSTPWATAGMVLRDAAILTTTTSAAMMAVSSAQTGSAWSAVNCICHMLDGDDRAFDDRFDRRDSPLGIALNASAMIAWATLHRLAFRKAQGFSALAAGFTTAGAAYVVDYHVVPKRFTPGIEKKLSRKQLLPIYVTLGLTLGLCGWRR